MNMFVRIVAIFLIAEDLMSKPMRKLIAFRVIVPKRSAHFQGFLFIIKKDQSQKVDRTVPAVQAAPATLAIINRFLNDTLTHTR
jgi:hypothetical protein